MMYHEAVLTMCTTLTEDTFRVHYFLFSLLILYRKQLIMKANPQR